MDYFSVFTTQLTDIFRIGLLTALIYTTEQNRAQTGVIVPLMAGIVFVAVIIPSVVTRSSADLLTSVGVGLFVNTIVVAAMWLTWSAYKSR